MPGYGTQFGNRRYGYEMDDLEGPAVHPVLPTVGQTNVPLNTKIIFDVSSEDGIIPGTVLVRIDRGFGYAVAYNQSEVPAFKTGYNGPESAVVDISGGYQVTIDPEAPFGNAEEILVEISASDTSGLPERLV